VTWCAWATVLGSEYATNVSVRPTKSLFFFELRIGITGHAGRLSQQPKARFESLRVHDRPLSSSRPIPIDARIRDAQRGDRRWRDRDLPGRRSRYRVRDWFPRRAWWIEFRGIPGNRCRPWKPHDGLASNSVRTRRSTRSCRPDSEWHVQNRERREPLRRGHDLSPLIESVCQIKPSP
jgi:hypothetical protein